MGTVIFQRASQQMLHMQPISELGESTISLFLPVNRLPAKSGGVFSIADATRKTANEMRSNTALVLEMPNI